MAGVLVGQQAAAEGSSSSTLPPAECDCDCQAYAIGSAHLVTLSPTNTSRLPARQRCACAWLNRRSWQPRTANWSAVPLAWPHCTAQSGSGPRREQCGGGGGGGGAGGNGMPLRLLACAPPPRAMLPPLPGPHRMQLGSGLRQVSPPRSACRQKGAWSGTGGGLPYLSDSKIWPAISQTLIAWPRSAGLVKRVARRCRRQQARCPPTHTRALALLTHLGRDK